MKKYFYSAAIAAFITASPAFAQDAPKGQQSQDQKAAQGTKQATSGEHSLAETAAHNSAAEVALGSLAVERANNYRVEHFGEMMHMHHGSALLELMRLAQDNESLSLPVMPTEEQSQEIQRLQKLSGEEFEEAYFEHQVQAHQRAVKVFEQGAEAAETEKLRQFFQTGLPIMRTHLQMAQDYQGMVGNAQTTADSTGGAAKDDAGDAERVQVTVELEGSQQVPPVETDATGKTEVAFDPEKRMLTWTLSYSGLSSEATGGHFHGPAEPGETAPPVVPIEEVASGSDGSAELTEEQAEQLMAGKWYVNVHTTKNPGGEIRGQVRPKQ